MSNLFKSHDVPVIDLDVLARVAVQPGSFALRSIVRHFGAERVLKPDGTLDREALGNIVFNDEKERRVLNGIVHPAVRRLLAWEVLKCWLRGQPICVVDAPLLIEAGLWRICGQIVVVYWCVRGGCSANVAAPSSCNSNACWSGTVVRPRRRALALPRRSRCRRSWSSPTS